MSRSRVTSYDREISRRWSTCKLARNLVGNDSVIIKANYVEYSEHEVGCLRSRSMPFNLSPFKHSKERSSCLAFSWELFAAFPLVAGPSNKLCREKKLLYVRMLRKITWVSKVQIAASVGTKIAVHFMLFAKALGSLDLGDSHGKQSVFPKTIL